MSSTTSRTKRKIQTTTKATKRRRLSKSLLDRRSKLLESCVEFDNAKQRFELVVPTSTDRNNTSPPVKMVKSGLTKILRQVFPVPFGDNDKSAPATSKPSKPAAIQMGKVVSGGALKWKGKRRRKSFRASRNDPQPEADVWTHTKPVKLKGIAHCCRDATVNCVLSQFNQNEGTSGYGPTFNKRHGVLVDEQLKLFAAGGLKALQVLYDNPDKAELILSKEQLGILKGGIDPCVSALLAYFAESGMKVVGAQIPVYSPAMNVATAIDVLCTDAATLSEMHLIEIKSSVKNGAAALNDANYTRLRGRLKSTSARGTPLSFYNQHQIQLWVMKHMLENDLLCKVDGAAVVRVSGGEAVHTYGLNKYYEDRAKKLQAAIKTKARNIHKIGKAKHNAQFRRAKRSGSYGTRSAPIRRK